MIIVSYDISNDNVRTSFSKLLKKHGRRLQFSVYEIKNSKRILEIILHDIDVKFSKRFTPQDSVFIYQICQADQKKMVRYGYNIHDQDDLLIFD